MPPPKDLQDISASRDFTAMIMKCNNSPNIAFILVEAKQNEILFRKLLHHTCKFFPCDGWENILFIMQQVTPNKMPNLIAIIDADFRRITQQIPTYPNVFLTDYHDTEMMTCFSDAWTNVLNTYEIPEQRKSFEQTYNCDLRTYLIQLLKPLACLRLLNEQEKWGLTFKSGNKLPYKPLNFSEFIDEKTLQFKTNQDLLKSVENKSNRQGFFTQDTTRCQQFDSFCSQHYDLLQLCNGHDLMHILSIALDKAISNKGNTEKIAPEQLTNDFITAYRLTDFEQTQLYNNLQTWQQQHPSIPKIL